MAEFDAADLLQRLKDACGRPATDASLTDTKGYRYLSDAQRSVAYTMAQHIPEVNYGVPVQLTTLDRQRYTLPGTPTPEWIGRILVLRSATGDALVEGAYDDRRADFTMEGPSSIRITRGRTWTGDAPYVRYMAKPATLSDDEDQAPTLLPTDARLAVVWIAASLWARRGGYRDPQPYLDEANAILWGRPQTGEPGLIPSYKAMAEGAYAETVPWYRGMA